MGGCGEWKTAEVVRGRVTRLDSPRLASRPDTTRLDSTRIEKPRQRQRERERERETVGESYSGVSGERGPGKESRTD